MDEPRVIQADFANWRPVSGRKVLQLVLEVPIGQTETVIKMLGVPMPGESKWVAVALLENGKCADGKTDGPQESAPKPSETTDPQDGQSGNSQHLTSAHIVKDGTLQKDRRKLSEMPLSQQCAFTCSDARFWKFLGHEYGEMPINAEEAASAIRKIIGIASRSDLDKNDTAAFVWHQIAHRYQTHLTDQQYAGARR